MRGAGTLLLALAVAALLAAGLAACGSDDSNSSTSSSTPATGSETTSTAPTDGGGSGTGEEESGEEDGSSEGSSDSTSGDEGSASFRTPGGDNSVQNFGDEAEAAEREAANAVLSGYLEARAKDDWAKECGYLAKATVKPLEQLAAQSQQLKGKGCAALLEALSAGIPASARANTMTAAIASLRVEGERGFALYHGAKGINYLVPMVKEGGEWKVGALAPTEIP